MDIIGSQAVAARQTQPQDIEKDIPLELFGGLCTEMSPGDLPQGASPLCQDVDFELGSVFSRAGTTPQFANQFAPGSGDMTFLKTFTLQNSNKQMLVATTTPNGGNLYYEDTTNNPNVLVQILSSFQAFVLSSVAQFARQYIAFGDGHNGLDIPRQWDGVNLDRVSQDGPGAPPAAADSATAGTITAGVHKLVVLFLTRQGYITKASPITSWTAAGSFAVALTNIPIGPPNVVSRIIAFTAAGGAFFFYIPFPTTGSTTGTVINDNTSTTATIDFADATLLSAISIDQPGNNLFALVTLKECAGVFAYADRLFWWGELNSIENLLNMSFDGAFSLGTGPGGADVPLGWTSDGSTGGGSQDSADALWGFAYKITGSGSSNTDRGTVFQGAFQDEFGTAIIQPNTQYSFRGRFRLGPGGTGAIPQSFSMILSSAGTGFSSTATVSAFNTLPVGAYGPKSAQFSLVTPASIPSDLRLTIKAHWGTAGTTNLLVEELEIFPTAIPVLTGQIRVSYADNPESFDGESGILGLLSVNNQAVRRLFQLRDTLYIKKENSQFSTVDNATSEPSGWSISTVSTKVGTASVNSGASGEEWEVDVSRDGLYMFNGNEPIKISQEIQPTWDTINWALDNRIWVLNDLAERRLFIGVATGSSVFPNTILMMNYRELNASWAIAEQGPIHIAYSGKIISWDMSRKWAPWSIPANCGAIVDRQNSVKQIWFANALALNALYLDPTNITDSGSMIPWIYCPFFFVNRDMEQMLQMGLHRKLYTYLTMFISGTGSVALTAISDSLTSLRSKILPSRNLTANPGYDMEVPLNWTGDRTTFQLASGGITSSFLLSKMLVTMKSDPYMPIRGRV